ncbi:MAG TPA: cupredoxin domain-containing protein, partial [Pseudomonadota bacterium]|nr:cupredoxin domain-containing protein [Pseudomonadota bacterium]
MRSVQQAALLVTLLTTGIFGGGCRKSEPPPPASGGPRRIEVTVSNQGFTPPRIMGRPGEDLTLSFRYDKSAGECGREVVLPSQNIKKTLTEEKPTEIALHLPQEKGEVTFTCGMNMLRGAIVV